MGYSTMVIGTDDSSDGKFNFLKVIEKHKTEVCLVLYNIYILLKVAWIFFFEVPEFKSIFESMNIELPLVTQWILATSDVLNEYWFIILPLVFGVVFNFVLFGVLYVKLRGIRYERYFQGLIPFALVFSATVGAFVLDKVIQIAIYLPMLRLTNSVG